MFGIGGCELWSSIFWAQRRGKCEHQMKGYVSPVKSYISTALLLTLYNALRTAYV